MASAISQDLPHYDGHFWFGVKKVFGKDVWFLQAAFEWILNQSINKTINHSVDKILYKVFSNSQRI